MVIFMNLKIENLSCNIKEKEVLKNFNLNIKEGEIHALMGPNGAGKSTITKVILRDPTYKVTSGDIKIDNESIINLTTDEVAKKGVFLSFQNPTSIEGVKNSEFLKEAINAKSENPISLYDFIKKLGIEQENLELNKEMLHRSLNENFSGGEKKKNEILQMKLLEPKLIILDELDSGLDVDSLKVVAKNINDYLDKNKKTSVLIISHYEKIYEYIKPQYVHIINNGTIVKDGDISLALEILKNGYKNYSSSINKIGEE